MTAPIGRALQGRFVLAEVLDGAPHPELVLAQRPTVPELVEAAAVLGAFGDGSYLSGQVRVSLITLLPPAADSGRRRADGRAAGEMRGRGGIGAGLEFAGLPPALA